MSTTRFDRPQPGVATAVQFPEIARQTLPNGLSLWSVRHSTVPVFTATLLIPSGTGEDPPERPGLASLTGDLMDEGAGTRDALELAEAFAQMGTQIEVEVGPDASSVSVTALGRFLEPALRLMADVVMRPRLEASDFSRVRDLRLNRLRQLSRSASTMADRAYVSAVFGTHPYGHGALGTSRSLEGITLGDAQEFWGRTFRPRGATLSIVADLTADHLNRLSEDMFGDWADSGAHSGGVKPFSGKPDARIVLVDKPGAPQSELRVGHTGPERRTPDYHALVVLNAVLGGQFTSRINRRLREEQGVTYGARTSFDFRRISGTFSCDTSVQADATARAVSDIIEELELIRREPVPAEELACAQASLTRGYVRNFETAGQVARAAAQLAIYGLDDRAFDRFVPTIESVTAADIHRAAAAHIRPDEVTVVVVGDAATCAVALEQIGRPVEHVVPEF